MKIDTVLAADLKSAGEQAKKLERAGFDGVLTFETSNNPFLPALLAAEHTERIELLTAVAVGFARNPMTLAHMGNDLNSFSQGRYTLGLGSQIKPHITKRFSMPWSNPAARMKEMILALHAIWDCWYEGKPLDFRGEFYTHTLMTPVFTPENTEYGRPKVALAAVGPKMTETAAAVADGLFIHGFTTERYLRDVTIPTVESQLEKSGRKRKDFEFIYPLFLVTGETEEAFLRVKRSVCKQIAFYGSTPAYRVVLEHHGWGELQSELNLLSKQGKWDEMGTLISDEILEAFAVVGEPEEVVPIIKARFGGLVDRLGVSFPGLNPERVPDLVRDLRAS